MSKRKKAGVPETVLKAACTAVGIALLLLLPCALLLHSRILPWEAGMVLEPLCAACALFISVILYCRSKKTAAMTSGLTLVCYLAVVLIVGLCLCGGELWGMRLVYQCAASAAGTTLGIMVSIQKNTRGKKRMRR